MQNKVITINKEYIAPIAKQYFSNICGFNRNEEKFKSKMNDALVVRDKIIDNINVRVVISSFDKEVISGNTITLEGIVFECNAIEQIRKESIIKIYAYVLTAGSMDIQDKPLVEMFYVDTWQTAYVDAGRDILNEMIRDSIYKDNTMNENEIFVSDSFGPGYYGMDVTQVKDFFKVLDCDEIDVKLTDSGLMLPLKSCIGFYIAVNDKKQLPAVGCKSCSSNIKGCQFCRIKTSKMKKK